VAGDARGPTLVRRKRGCPPGRADGDAARERHRPLVQVLAAEPDVLVRVTVLEDADAREARVGVLDSDHGVGALRERRAGHDPRCLAGPERDGRECARGDRLEHRQLDRGRVARPEDVRPANGVAVHRRVGPVRERDRRDHVVRQHATERVAQRHRLLLERSHPRDDPRDRLGHREHQGAPSVAPARNAARVSCTRSTSRFGTTWLFASIEKSSRRPSAVVT
jgi:hypothetical protein